MSIEEVTVIDCPVCGEPFDPQGTRRRYCSKKCKKHVELKLRKKPETVTDRIVAVKGRRCSNCRTDHKGQRFVFWWDDYDRADEVVETAMVLCSGCWRRFNRQKAREEGQNLKWEMDADPLGHVIPF